MFYTAEEVSKLLGISKSLAYKKIKAWNNDLKEQGYITVAGKIPKAYFEDHFYKGVNE